MGALEKEPLNWLESAESEGIIKGRECFMFEITWPGVFKLLDFKINERE